MKFRVFLLTTILISSCFYIYSNPYYGDDEKTGYLRTDVIVSYWDSQWIDDELDGYVIGYGMSNSLGDDKLFAGFHLIYFQFVDEFERIEPAGLNLGFEIGTLIPLSKLDRIIVAGAYSHYYLKGAGDGFFPSVRLGYSRNRFSFSLGYNFKFGMFSNIGFHQTF